MQYMDFLNKVNESLTQKDIVAKKKDVKAIFETALENIVDLLSKKDSLSINNFGKFSIFEAKSKKGRNPKTGEEIIIPAKKRPKFNFAGAIKKMVIE